MRTPTSLTVPHPRWGAKRALRLDRLPEILVGLSTSRIPTERVPEPGRSAHAGEAPVPHENALIDLQRAAGNRAVTRLVAARHQLARQPAPKTPPVVAAGLASTSPQQEFSKDLHNELARIANAKVLIEFVRAKRGTAAQVPATLDLGAVLADTPTVKKLKPQPQAVADLQPVVDLLVFYGVLSGNSPTLSVKADASTGDVDTAKFDQASAAVARATTDFDRRAAALNPVDPIGQTELIDIAQAAGTAGEKKMDRDSEQAVQNIKTQLAEHVVLLSPGADAKARAPITRVTVDALPSPVTNPSGVVVLQLPVAGSTKPVEVAASDVVRIESVAAGTDPATVKLRDKLTAALDKAIKAMHAAQGYRTFSLPVADFLRRLRTRNTRFFAGTYPTHQWAEYSVDMDLTIAVDTDGFYSRPQAEQFLDDVNATALDTSGPYGAFQWHAVYNDMRISNTINSKYGAGRMHQAPHHGPAPDKLHIHLDLRPVAIAPDKVSGFSIGPGGRIIVP
jgi:hypothetical protein